MEGKGMGINRESLNVVGAWLVMRQNSWYGASVGGIVSQTLMTIMSPLFRVNMAML